MSELIISGSSVVSAQHWQRVREAAENFMQFMNDQGAYAPNTLRDSGCWCFIHRRAGVTLASLHGFRSHQKWPASIFFQLHDADLASTIDNTTPCLTCCFLIVAFRHFRMIKVFSLAMRHYPARSCNGKKANEQAGYTAAMGRPETLLDVLLSRSERLNYLQPGFSLYLHTIR
uniref:Uncharacterized protein n=1 Tax=Salmonella sp. TaxID=599 RepID=A0A482ETS5_SALSP|nr:hypothetical protein [Salmonella sp.]QBM91436.1 hypothetical protein NNIBIDOC_00106 [Salmonella sp.]